MSIEEDREKLLKEDDRLLAKYDKLEERKRMIANEIRKMAKFDSKQKRNERSQRLFHRGGMVESVLGEDFDEEFFIGCLLGIKKIEIGGKVFLQFKEHGRKYLGSKK